MKRDFSLIRELLLKLEATELKPGRFLTIRPDAQALSVEGYEPDMVMYHLRQLEEAGLVKFGSPSPIDGTLLFSRLTWAGHDYLDAIRDPEIWRKTKKEADALGGFTLELVKDLATGFIKTKIEEHTGVKL
jgi:DNA-binding transcriptional ArsR family regulator